MDNHAKQLLDQCRDAIKAGDWAKANELLEQYEYWRATGGAAPPDGDYRALAYRMQINMGMRK